MPPLRVAVIGAGISGCCAASTLAARLSKTKLNTEITSLKANPSIGMAMNKMKNANISEECNIAQGPFSVTIFESGRGAGGRMSTRRTDNNGRFDHGAQYISVKKDKSSPKFLHFIEQMEKSGVAAEWTGRFVEITKKDDNNFSTMPSAVESKRRIVGVPGMNCICKHLVVNREGDNILTKFGTRVRSLQYDEGTEKWSLLCTDGTARKDGNSTFVEGPFDGIIASDKLLASDSVSKLFKGEQWPLFEIKDKVQDIVKSMRSISSTPSFVLMLELNSSLRGPATGEESTSVFDSAVVHNSDTIAWIARDSSKPGRLSDGVERWIVQSTGEFAKKKLDDDNESLRKLPRGSKEYELAFQNIGEEIFDEFRRILVSSDERIEVSVRSKIVHRWGAGFPLCNLVEEDFQKSLTNEEMKIVSCGDWTMSPNVEGAVVSGIEAGEKMANILMYGKTN